jgi:hypothetical protein
VAENNSEKRSDIFTLIEDLVENPLGKVLCSSPSIIQLIDRVKNPIPFSSEELVKFDHQLVSLSPLFYSFTRTRKREALEHQVQREVWELPISLSGKEYEFQNEVLGTIVSTLG